MLQESSSVNTTEEAQNRKFVVSELHANLKPVCSLPGLREACVDSPVSTSAGFCQLLPVPVAYMKGHSTETALLKVLDSVYTAANDKHVTVLIGLDLSAAFDTV